MIPSSSYGVRCTPAQTLPILYESIQFVRQLCYFSFFVLSSISGDIGDS